MDGDKERGAAEAKDSHLETPAAMDPPGWPYLTGESEE